MAADTPNTALLLPRKTQEAIINYHNQCFTMQNQQFNIREQLRQMDLAYSRETDLTKDHVRAKLSNKYGDSSKLQNIVVPVVFPAVEAAVTYQSSVFLSGNPIFGVSSDAANEDAALQTESIIADSSIKGGWVAQLQMSLRDGFKYNISATEVGWEKLTTASLETDLTFSAKQAKQTETIWEGNIIKHLDMYNTFWDTRVQPTKVHTHGEYAGYNEIMSRIDLKDFINKLNDKLVENVTLALESGTIGSADTGTGAAETYYVPEINSEALLGKNPLLSTDWLAWAGIAGAEQKIMYRNVYEVTTLYAKILPADFGLKVPSKNTPQIWKFIIINHNVVIYAERQTNAHGFLPILFMQPLEDGLGYQTKSLAGNSTAFQAIASTMVNSTFAARRRAISDRGLYDPSRVEERHINSPNPSAKIPIKPAAYGKPLSEAYYPIPFRDDQSGIILQELPLITRMADIVNGQNPTKQGQFVKGNKTKQEFKDVMNNANGRDQNTSILLEAQFFTPMKEIIKINILQYQGATSIYNPKIKESVTINPVILRKAVMAFDISDGLLPTSKIINAEALTVALQTLATSPHIARGYNIAPMFSYLMKTQGAHLAEFEKSAAQIAYEDAIVSWQTATQALTAELTVLVKVAIPEKLTELIKEFNATLPPQPKPQDYNYIPQGLGVSKQQQQPSGV